MVTRWRHCGDYVRTYLRDLRLSFSNCVSGASHSYDIKAKSKYKNFNTDQGHQVKTNNWKKTSETSSTANNNRRGRSQCKVRGWFSKSQISTYKQRWRCIGCTKSKKRSVTKDLDTTKHRIHDSVASTLDQWQDQQLICK